MIENGYVKLQRSIAQKSWFGEPTTVQLYVILLLNVAFKDIEYDGHAIRAGQFVTSRSKLSAMTGLTERQTRTALSHLKTSGDISVTSNTKFSIITLNNYPLALSEDGSDDPPGDRRVDPPNVLRSKSNKEEVIKEEVVEVEASAAPPTDTPTDFNDRSSSFSSGNNGTPSANNTSADERKALADRYGEAAVELYENKFRAWAAAKNTVSARMYPTIAKWLALDIGTQPQKSLKLKTNGSGSSPGSSRYSAAQEKNMTSSLDIDKLMKAVMDGYKK